MLLWVIDGSKTWQIIRVRNKWKNISSGILYVRSYNPRAYINIFSHNQWTYRTKGFSFLLTYNILCIAFATYFNLWTDEIQQWIRFELFIHFDLSSYRFASC